MTISTDNRQESDSYRVYLLRLWRERNGPWHASLQPAGEATPHRFADMDALVAFLRQLAPALASTPAPAPTASGKPQAEE